MEDVRKAAQSRAARENRAPLGTSFESERRRSKNALVNITTTNLMEKRSLRAPG